MTVSGRMRVDHRRRARRQLRVGMGLAAGLFAALAAAPLAAQTLVETLSLAYQNNPRLLSERAALRATDEGVAQALAGWRPTIEVTGDVAKLYSSSSFGGGPSSSVNSEPRGAALTIRQNIYRGGRTVAAVSRAENDVEAERARLLSIEQTVLRDAATAFVDVVRDQAVVQLNVSNERVLERQLEATRDRFRVGEVTRTDVAQAESRLSRAQAERVAAEGLLIQSRARYRNVVGIEPGKLDPAEPFGGLPVREEDAIAAARESNFTVRQARFAEAGAGDRVREVLGELLPLVTIDGGASTRAGSASGGTTVETDSLSLTARLRMPLYQSGSVASRVRQARQIALQRRNDLNDAVRGAAEAVTRAWEALETARAQIQSFSAGVKAARIALEGVQQEALVGSRTVLDVLDAEQELLDARVNLVRAQRNEVVATLDLRVAIGALTAKRLELPVTLYDFSRNYDRVRNRWFGIGIEEKK